MIVELSKDSPWKTKMKKKFLLGGGIIVLVAVVVFVVWQTKIIQRINQAWQERQVLNKVEGIKNAWRSDTVGGATPEETLVLFIEAFEAGDLDLASKYFVVDKQAEFLTKMKNWVKLRKEGEIVKILSKAEWSGESGESQDQIDVWNDNKELVTSIFFRKNEFNQKWKISNI